MVWHTQANGDKYAEVEPFRVTIRRGRYVQYLFSRRLRGMDCALESGSKETVAEALHAVQRIVRRAFAGSDALTRAKAEALIKEMKWNEPKALSPLPATGISLDAQQAGDSASATSVAACPGCPGNPPIDKQQSLRHEAMAQ